MRVRGRPRLADSVRAACFVIVTETSAAVATAMAIAKGILLMVLVVLSSRHGPVKVLAVLGASAHVLKTIDKEATVLTIGDGPMPQVQWAQTTSQSLLGSTLQRAYQVGI